MPFFREAPFATMMPNTDKRHRVRTSMLGPRRSPATCTRARSEPGTRSAGGPQLRAAAQLAVIRCRGTARGHSGTNGTPKTRTDCRLLLSDIAKTCECLPPFTRKKNNSIKRTRLLLVTLNFRGKMRATRLAAPACAPHASETIIAFDGNQRSDFEQCYAVKILKYKEQSKQSYLQYRASIISL